jgi:hypothetical protein
MIPHARPSSYRVVAADALAAKFGPSACAHAYKNDVHLGQWIGDSVLGIDAEV